jgi:hypothetical protein
VTVTPRGVGRAELVGIAALLGLLAAVTLYVIVLDRQFTWDESIYATKTRSLVTAIPATGWAIYRPPGLAVVGLAAAPLGIADVGLRVASAAWGILAIGLAWGFTRMLWGPLAAGIAVLAVIASPVVLAQIARFHNDLPVVAPILALMVLLWWQMEERERPGWPLLAAGPLAASAFYLRYGALAILLGVGLAATLLWWRHALRHGRLVGAALLVAAALFVPHVVEAIGATGSPLGIVRSAVSMVDQSDPLGSAWTYLRWIPSQLAGVVGGALGIAALGYAAYAAVDSLRSRRPTPASRRLAWLLLPAAVAALGTVLVSHAEARYVVAPIVLVEIAGAGGVAAALRSLATRFDRHRPDLAPMVAPAALVAMVAVVGAMGVLWVRDEARAAKERWLIDAGGRIADDAGGACAVVSSMPPILSWYTGCDPLSFDDPTIARSRAAQGEPVYVVLTSMDAKRDDLDAISRYASALSLEVVATTSGTDAWAEAYRVMP